MAASHGSTAVCKIQDSGGVLQDVSQYLTDAGLNRSIDMAESSALGNTEKAYIAGLADGTLPLQGNWDPTVDGIFAGIVRMVRTFEYYPAGTAGGVGTNVKYSGSLLISSYDIKTPLNGLATFSVTAQKTGALTRALI